MFREVGQRTQIQLNNLMCKSIRRSLIEIRLSASSELLLQQSMRLATVLCRTTRMICSKNTLREKTQTTRLRLSLLRPLCCSRILILSSAQFPESPGTPIRMQMPEYPYAMPCCASNKCPTKCLLSPTSGISTTPTNLRRPLLLPAPSARVSSITETLKSWQAALTMDRFHSSISEREMQKEWWLPPIRPYLRRVIMIQCMTSIG